MAWSWLDHKSTSSPSPDSKVKALQRHDGCWKWSWRFSLWHSLHPFFRINWGRHDPGQIQQTPQWFDCQVDWLVSACLLSPPAGNNLPFAGYHCS
jgi:hypothetical protein